MDRPPAVIERPDEDEIDIAVFCSDVVKAYGSGDTRVLALRGVDLNVRPAELLMLVGPPGCGETPPSSVTAGNPAQDAPRRAPEISGDRPACAAPEGRVAATGAVATLGNAVARCVEGGTFTSAEVCAFPETSGSAALGCEAQLHAPRRTTHAPADDRDARRLGVTGQEGMWGIECGHRGVRSLATRQHDHARSTRQVCQQLGLLQLAVGDDERRPAGTSCCIDHVAQPGRMISRAAAPLGDTSVGRPCSSFTTRSGASRVLPRADSVSNHHRSSSPTYTPETSKLNTTFDAQFNCTSMASSTAFLPAPRSIWATTRSGAGNSLSQRARSSSGSP